MKTSSQDQYSPYVCPNRNDDMLPIAYSIAVMSAAAQGAPVQYRRHWQTPQWSPAATPVWDWGNTDYRIDPASKPAPEVNPAPNNPYFQIGPILMLTYGEGVYTRLTAPTGLVSPEQVRQLMLEQARKEGFVVGARVRFSNLYDSSIHALLAWLPGDVTPSDHNSPAIEHERKECKPFVYATSTGGFAVPIRCLKLAPPAKEPTKVPLTPADLTGDSLWVRWCANAEESLVILITRQGDLLLGSAGTHLLTLEKAMASQYQWSSDRVNWKPFYKLA